MLIALALCTLLCDLNINPTTLIIRFRHLPISTPKFGHAKNGSLMQTKKDIDVNTTTIFQNKSICQIRFTSCLKNNKNPNLTQKMATYVRTKNENWFCCAAVTRDTASADNLSGLGTKPQLSGLYSASANLYRRPVPAERQTQAHNNNISSGRSAFCVRIWKAALAQTLTMAILSSNPMIAYWRLIIKSQRRFRMLGCIP